MDDDAGRAGHLGVARIELQRPDRARFRSLRFEACEARTAHQGEVFRRLETILQVSRNNLVLGIVGKIAANLGARVCIMIDIDPARVDPVLRKVEARNDVMVTQQFRERRHFEIHAKGRLTVVEELFDVGIGRSNFDSAFILAVPVEGRAQETLPTTILEVLELEHRHLVALWIEIEDEVASRSRRKSVGAGYVVLLQDHVGHRDRAIVIHEIVDACVARTHVIARTRLRADPVAADQIARVLVGAANVVAELFGSPSHFDVARECIIGGGEARVR